ncbi:MAG: hypothetical protein NVS3B25_09660 [Hymenobacter sp.]
MRLYVASAFANKPEVIATMEALRMAGHEVSHDWTTEQVDLEWAADRTDAYLQQCGADDFRGVRYADALVLVNHEHARDAMTEFGIALGRGTPVYVLYPERRTSVFFHRAQLCWGLGDLIRRLKSQTQRMEEVVHTGVPHVAV